MAKASDIILCLQAQNIEGAGVSANNILTALNPEYIPGLFSFSIIVIIVDLNRMEGHTCSVDLLDPSNESVIRMNGNIPILEDKSNLPDEYKGLNLSMELNNVNFKRSGLYTFKVSIDEEEIGRKEFYVKGKNE